MEAELERDQTALQLLLAHPRGELPEAVPSNAVVTAAAASALQAADEEKRRRDEADAIRRQSDADAADRARRDRMHKLRQLAFPAVDAPVSAAPRHRARSESPEQQLPRPVKKTRFAQPDPHARPPSLATGTVPVTRRLITRGGGPGSWQSSGLPGYESGG